MNSTKVRSPLSWRDGLRKNVEAGDVQIEAQVRDRVEATCVRLTIYQGF